MHLTGGRVATASLVLVLLSGCGTHDSAASRVHSCQAFRRASVPVQRDYLRRKYAFMRGFAARQYGRTGISSLSAAVHDPGTPTRALIEHLRIDTVAACGIPDQLPEAAVIVAYTGGRANFPGP